MRVYLSQLDDSIYESQDSIESFYKEIDDTYGTRHFSVESYKIVSTQVHQIHVKMIYYFSKQSDIIMKFDPEFGAYIKENIESLKVITSKVLDMMKDTQTLENQTKAFTAETSATNFGMQMFEMQRISLVIETTINSVADGATSTLDFIEEKW